MLPKVSIIIYNHNNENGIEDCLSSVCDQDYKNKEVVIVDDASTDGSWYKILNLIGNNSNLDMATGSYKDVNTDVILNTYEGGKPAAFLTGCNLIWRETNIVGFIDSHDRYLPGKISDSINCIAKLYDRVGIIYSDYITEIDGIKTAQYRQPFSRQNINLGNCVFVTKPAIERAGMINLDKGVDAFEDLFFRITEHFVAMHVPLTLSEERNDLT